MKWLHPIKLIKELERKLTENQELAKRVSERTKDSSLKQELAEAGQRFE